MRRRALLAATGAALALPSIARAETFPRIVIGMSGWAGFAPLTLADAAGLFRANGLDVETRFVPQRERNLGLLSGTLTAAVASVDTMIAWAGAGVPLTQVLVLGRSRGADGIAARPGITRLAELRGRGVIVDGPGTTPHFLLAYLLREAGVPLREVTLQTLAPQQAALAFIAGQHDAAVTIEPYLTQIRALDAGHARILATTAEHPCIADTLAFPPAFLRANPEAVRRVVRSWFDALDLISREPERAYDLMGRRVAQSGPALRDSAARTEWQDAARNRAYLAEGLPELIRRAAAIQRETGVIRAEPPLGPLLDASFVATTGRPAPPAPVAAAAVPPAPVAAPPADAGTLPPPDGAPAPPAPGMEPGFARLEPPSAAQPPPAAPAAPAPAPLSAPLPAPAQSAPAPGTPASPTVAPAASNPVAQPWWRLLTPPAPTITAPYP